MSGEYLYKGRINYFLVKCHIYQGNKQIYNDLVYPLTPDIGFCLSVGVRRLARDCLREAGRGLSLALVRTRHCLRGSGAASSSRELSLPVVSSWSGSLSLVALGAAAGLAAFTFLNWWKTDFGFSFRIFLLLASEYFLFILGLELLSTETKNHIINIISISIWSTSHVHLDETDTTHITVAFLVLLLLRSIVLWLRLSYFNLSTASVHIPSL